MEQTATGEAAGQQFLAEPFFFSGATRAELMANLACGRAMCQQESLAWANGQWHAWARRCYLVSSLPGNHWRVGICCSNPPAFREGIANALAFLEGQTGQIRGFHFGQGYRPGRLAFLFPGQGSQRVDMLRELIESYPEGGAAMWRADSLLDGVWRQPLSRFIYPRSPDSEQERMACEQELADTSITQPALGAVELAALSILRRFGIYPDMVAGHSYGDLVALAAAGGISKDDLLHLSVIRGALCARVGRSHAAVVAAVQAQENIVHEVIEQARAHVRICYMNSPRQTVVAGKPAMMDQVIPLFQCRGIKVKRLNLSMAFHVPELEPASVGMHEALQAILVQRPQTPVYLSVLGAPYTGDSGMLRKVMARHLVMPVRFMATVEAMYEQGGARVFLEIGPRRTLTGLVSQILGERDHLAMALDDRAGAGREQLAHILATLHATGAPVNLDAWFVQDKGWAGTTERPAGITCQ